MDTTNINLHWIAHSSRPKFWLRWESGLEALTSLKLMSFKLDFLFFLPPSLLLHPAWRMRREDMTEPSLMITSQVTHLPYMGLVLVRWVADDDDNDDDDDDDYYYYYYYGRTLCDASMLCFADVFIGFLWPP